MNITTAYSVKDFGGAAQAAPLSLPGPVRAGASSASFQAVEDVLDLSRESRDVIAAYNDLSPAEQESFLSMLAQLLRHDVLGTELLDVGGKAEQSFASVNMADDNLRGATPWPETGRRLDLVA